MNSNWGEKNLFNFGNENWYTFEEKYNHFSFMCKVAGELGFGRAWHNGIFWECWAFLCKEYRFLIPNEWVIIWGR